MSTPSPTTIGAQEQALVARIRRGDRAAARDLVNMHRDRLFAFLRRMVHNHHDAEEICQEAFLKAFASLDSYSSEYRFSTWLFTIGYRVCLNWLRRKQPLSGDVDFTHLESGISDEASVAESEEAALLRREVWGAVAELSPPQKATILLFYRHELSCQEIAQVLDLPIATVKSHLHRARGRLRTLLEPLAAGKDARRLRNLAG